MDISILTYRHTYTKLTWCNTLLTQPLPPPPAPAPSFVVDMLGTECIDKNYKNSQWYWSRGKQPRKSIGDFDSPTVEEQKISANHIVFSFHVGDLEYTFFLEFITAYSVDYRMIRSEGSFMEISSTELFIEMFEEVSCVL